MSVFTEAELQYLRGGRQLGRIATVGADGTPHVVPVGWIYNAARDTIDVGGRELERSKKFRDVARTGRAAIVIDDLESIDRGARGRSRSAAELRRSLCRRRSSGFIRSGSSVGGSDTAAARGQPSRDLPALDLEGRECTW